MEKIDLKDRKILYQLDLDARQSLTQIGKKVGLKKDVVSYRIKRMQDIGLIRKFYTVIDAYKLGYTVFRFYLNFQYADPNKKKEIIDYFVKYKNTWVVFSITGKYDLGLVLWIKDIHDFYNFWNKTLDLYGDFFSQKVFSLYIQAYSYRPSYLLLEEFNESDRLKHEIVGMGTKFNIDETDYKILNELAEDARMPLIDLAEKLGCTSQTVTYRIKNLIDNGVIQAFRTSYDISKLGLHHYKIDIYLKEHSQRNNIMNYIRTNPHLMFIGTSAGVSDLELEFHVENAEKLIEIVDDIIAKFPGAVKNYEYFSGSNYYKVRLIPEL